MKQNLRMAGIVLLLAALVLASCKKKTDDSPRAKLTGKWKVIETADDFNNNSVMDPSEIQLIPDSFAFYVTFSADGTANISQTISGLTQTATFTWELINNNADLKTIQTSGSTVGYESTAHIESLSGSDLIVKSTDTASGVPAISWSILKKQ